MRRPFVVGNWKMNCRLAEARELALGLRAGLPADARAEVGVAPPFLAIPGVVEALRGSPIRVGAQDLFWEGGMGAFTGEVSAEMLLDAGCSFVLCGHSERRHVIGESDAVVRRKLDAALGAGLQVILCIGETLAERDAGQTNDRLRVQIEAGLGGLSREALRRVVVAYEPVWAIGTGRTATTAQAEEAQAFVRSLVATLFDAAAAAELVIQYGGSVKPGNARELMSEPDVDGALVGGAALDAPGFLAIIAGA